MKEGAGTPGKFTRRQFAVVGVSTLSALAMPRIARAGGAALSIGYQKNGSLLVLKQQGTLEKRFESQGVVVSWHEFPSGPPLLEALNAGAVDFGATGDTPPLFAQAAGADLVYVAYQPVPGNNSAILVHDDGPIRALADLKGKRVAFTKGSSAHNVIVQVLRHAGLSYGDIKPFYLQPPDAAAAFRQGAIDAWSIWDPFYALAEREPGTRVLTTAFGIAPSNSFFLASRSYAAKNPAIVTAVIEETTRVTKWIGAHQEELARLMAAATGVPLDIQRIAAARGNYDTGWMTDAVVAQQQGIADIFHELRLLPTSIRVSDAVWRPAA
jgi:aliphatic sulfonates family ABC transporter substrate-binding protein